MKCCYLDHRAIYTDGLKAKYKVAAAALSDNSSAQVSPPGNANIFKSDKKLKGNMIRSRAKWLSEGEKPSRYFCALEKHLYMEKTIRKLVTDDGKVIHDHTKIP